MSSTRYVHVWILNMASIVRAIINTVVSATAPRSIHQNLVPTTCLLFLQQSLLLRRVSYDFERVISRILLEDYQNLSGLFGELVTLFVIVISDIYQKHIMRYYLKNLFC